MSEMLDAIDRLYRRVVMMIGAGRVSTTGDAGSVQRLQVQLRGDSEIRDSTPRVAEYGFTSVPIPGCDAVVIFAGGDRSEGIIIATGDQRYRLSNLAPGEVAIHDDQGQKVHLTRSGIIIHSPIKIRFEAPVIELHASTSYRWDVNGHGQHWYGTYIDTWQIGETAGTAHNISPPEIS